MTWSRQRPVAWSKADLGALALMELPERPPMRSMGAMEAALSGMRVSGGITYSPCTSYLESGAAMVTTRGKGVGSWGG